MYELDHWHEGVHTKLGVGVHFFDKPFNVYLCRWPAGSVDDSDRFAMNIDWFKEMGDATALMHTLYGQLAVDPQCLDHLVMAGQL